MKVYCINDDNLKLSITKGNWYHVMDQHDIKGSPSVSDLDEYNSLCYRVVTNRGVTSLISKSKFMTLSEIRNQKLNSILNE